MLAIFRRSPTQPASSVLPVLTQFLGNSPALARAFDLWRETMKTIAAGLMLLLLFLIPDDSFAGSGHCARDFWGNCAGGRGHGHRQAASWRERYSYGHYRHCAKDFWGRCADGRPRWRGHHHHVERGDVDRGLFCHPRGRVIGTEQKTREKARYAADDAWMGAMRYDFGERFQDLNYAKDVRHNCDLSSKTPFLKSARFRCVVEATPCRAPAGAAEERVETRYEEEGE
jgi:hypothetical protein